MYVIFNRIFIIEPGFTLIVSEPLTMLNSIIPHVDGNSLKEPITSMEESLELMEVLLVSVDVVLVSPSMLAVLVVMVLSGLSPKPLIWVFITMYRDMGISRTRIIIETI